MLPISYGPSGELQFFVLVVTPFFEYYDINNVTYQPH